MEGGITILRGLSDTEVNELLAQVSPSRIPPEIQQRIKELIGNNPYLLQVAVSEFLKGNKQIAVDKFEEVLFTRLEDGLQRMLTGWNSRLCQAFLALIQKQELSKFRYELINLEQQGLVVKIDEQWRLRANIFQKLITTHSQQVWCEQNQKV